VQTSTVTVAVLPEPTQAELDLPWSELDWKTCRGSGAGGQHRNVTESAVIMTHRSTGLQVRVESERSQHQNKAAAYKLLRARLWALKQEQRAGRRADQRRAQVGSGMRGDKRRTVRVRDGKVVDHVDGRRWRLKAYLRGEW
jgi:peptide chain release factor 1